MIGMGKFAVSDYLGKNKLPLVTEIISSLLPAAASLPARGQGKAPLKTTPHCGHSGDGVTSYRVVSSLPAAVSPSGEKILGSTSGRIHRH